MKIFIHNILKVYKRDLRAIIKNWVALVIALGLCILPSLYAWINIKACWDPYGNTSTIPVAIVNNDHSASIKGKDFNIGDSVVKNLKTNKQLGWKFVSEKEASMGIVDGTYYAVIIIPSNFSSSFTNILSDNYKKPQITYMSYSKANPVVGKITETAKNTLVEQIKSNFVATVNEAVFTSLNQVGIDAQQNKNNIIKLKDNIVKTDQNLDTILNSLQFINESSGNLSTFLTEIKATLPSIGSGLDIIQESNSNNIETLKTSQNIINSSLDNVNTNLNTSQAAVYRMQALLNSLNTSSSGVNAAFINSTVAQMNLQLQYLNTQISALINYLQQLNNTSPNENLVNMITSLKSIQTSLNDEKGKIANLQQMYISANSINKSILDNINNSNANISNQLINATQIYNQKAKVSLNNISNNLITASNDASSLIDSAKGLNNQISDLMSTGIDGSNLTNKVSSDLLNRLNEFKTVISQLSEKLEQVNDNDLSKLLAILQSNPKFMGSFISSPFNLKDDPIYEIPNYGSAMSPIYSILALWVGSLLLVSIFSTDSAEFEGSDQISIREKHFGKMLLFCTFAIIQGIIVSAGDVILLGIYVVNAPLLIAVSIVSSICFTIITFTLVSVMDNFGKALSIIFLIMQIAGSGGSYPIQVDPLIFRILQPMFPFTYSISGYREAIAGPLISNVFFDFTALIIIAVIFILIGFFLKEPFYPLIKKFEKKFEQSGLGA